MTDFLDDFNDLSNLVIAPKITKPKIKKESKQVGRPRKTEEERTRTRIAPVDFNKITPAKPTGIELEFNANSNGVMISTCGCYAYYWVKYPQASHFTYFAYHDLEIFQHLDITKELLRGLTNDPTLIVEQKVCDDVVVLKDWLRDKENTKYEAKKLAEKMAESDKEMDLLNQFVEEQMREKDNADYINSSDNKESVPVTNEILSEPIESSSISDRDAMAPLDSVDTNIQTESTITSKAAFKLPWEK